MDDLSFLLASPFTARQAASVGVRARQLRDLVESGFVRRLMRGVYVGRHVPDSLRLRRDAVRLVAPADAVVTDRIAGWLHGAPMILGPNSDLRTPELTVFHRKEHHRLRNGLVVSGQRTMPEHHVVDMGGLMVTSPLRTAWDLGRLLPRLQAIAALDSMSALALFTTEELTRGMSQFKGYRGVRQLRTLVPLADGRAQSPPESALRLLWLECGDLPAPDLQVRVDGPHGAPFFLDLGVESLRFAAEYDGKEFHHEGTRGRDEWRRDCLAQAGWTVQVFTSEHVYGQDPPAPAMLREGLARALANRMQGRRTA